MSDIFNRLSGQGDVLAHIEDSLRSNEMASIEQAFTIGIQVINVTCPCGGACENENGSTMIEYFDNVVYCGECQQRFVVPVSAFEKSHVTIEEKLR